MNKNYSKLEIILWLQVTPAPNPKVDASYTSV